MNVSEKKPNLPTWLFVVTDLALIGAAAVIAFRSAQPLSNTAVLAIVVCVGLGAIAGLVPIVAGYERQKNETLDDRQRALEALSRTVSASAEQISIATGSLHEIAEVSQKNLRHAEHLPHKLQEKIAEFQAQLAAANDVEKEELERELVALRTSESERLDSVSTRIAKSAAEWAKLEASTVQHLNATTEAVAKLPASTAAAIAKAQTAADHALAEARLAAGRTIAEAEGNATRAIAAAQAAGLIALEARLNDLVTRLDAATAAAADRAGSDFRSTLAAATRGLDEKIVQLESLVRTLESAAAKIPAAPVVVVEPPVVTEPPVAPTEPVADQAVIAESTPTPVPEIAAPPPQKRHRRTRREESTVTEVTPTPAPEPSPAMVEPEVSPAVEAVVAAANAPESPASPAAEPPPVEPPPPVPAEKTPEEAPPILAAPEVMATPPAEVSTAPAMPAPSPNVASTAPEAAAESEPSEAAKPAAPQKKRATRKPEPEPEPSLDLPLDDSPSTATPGHIERTLTSDGATRLLATAYIGIGNRLFIRGDGPGLSWEKGVPLQFVSIGKWRWETSDATAPIRFKLYKNDELECTALGEQTLEPSHLQEMTASF